MGNAQKRECRGTGHGGRGTKTASIRGRLQQDKVHLKLGEPGNRCKPRGCEKGLLRSQKEGAWEVRAWNQSSSPEKHLQCISRGGHNYSPRPHAFFFFFLQCDFDILLLKDGVLHLGSHSD